jgi:predicted transcriptional regulator
MENVATSVRINGDAAHILTGLATKLEKPKAQVVEMALRDLEERIFWADVHSAFAQTAANPEESSRRDAEIRLWERTSETDFQDEQW